jgi:type III pantothenate kinase
MSGGPCLQLDVGNSSAKWRLVDGGEVLARGRYMPGDEVSRAQLCALSPVPQGIWISSVAAEAAELALMELLTAQWQVKPWFARTQAQTAGLINSYEHPERMGVDRWLAMLGARARSSARLCVVDVGSALTIDLVDENNVHEGGYIIPGPHLMERALLLDTDRVRFEEQVDFALTPGVSTAEAVRHGIALAQAGALALALDEGPEAQTQLFFCGGGGELLMKLLNRGGIFVPDLVFEGLEVMARLSLSD